MCKLEGVAARPSSSGQTTTEQIIFCLFLGPKILPSLSVRHDLILWPLKRVFFQLFSPKQKSLHRKRLITARPAGARRAQNRYSLRDSRHGFSSVGLSLLAPKSSPDNLNLPDFVYLVSSGQAVFNYCLLAGSLTELRIQ